MVSAGDEGTHLPADAAVELDDEQDGSRGLVLAEGDGVEGRDGDVGAVDEWRPDVDLLVALVRRRDGRTEGDLLAPVAGVHEEPVVVDPDLVVRVPGRHGDLEVGGEDVGDRGVEGVDGDVLEDEPGLRRLKYCPDDEDGHQHDEQEDQQPGEDPPEYYSPLLPVVAAVLGRRHGVCALSWCGKSKA